MVIDRLTKMSYFIRCSKNLDARQFTKPFMKDIVRLHILLDNIITDRGTLFTSDQGKETTGKIAIERTISTAFNPETDWQTERTHAILEQYLHGYINYQQDYCSGYIPRAEIAYDNGC